MKSAKNKPVKSSNSKHQEFIATSFHNMLAHMCKHHIKAFLFSMNEINYIKLAQRKDPFGFPQEITQNFQYYSNMPSC